MSDPKHRAAKTFYGVWVVAGSFVLLFLFAGAGFYSFSIFIKPLENEFGWSRSSVSLAMSLYMMTQGLVAPFIGRAIETYGTRRVMTTSALLSGCAFILVSFTWSLWYFYGAYVLLSLSTTGMGFIPVSSVLTRWFVRRRGTAIGFAMVGISLGGFLLAPVVGWIIVHFGWRVSFVLLGFLVWTLALPITLFVIKGDPAEMGLLPDGEDQPAGRSPLGATHSSPSHAPRVDGWPLQAAVKTRAFFWLAVTFFVAPVAQMALLQHQVPLIIEAGISEVLAATALGLTAGLGGLGKVSFGRISEIVPFHYAVMLCFGLQATAVLVLLSGQTVVTVWLYVAVFGFSMGGVIVLLPLAVSHYFGLASFGVIMGVVSLILAAGNASGAFLSGLIYDAVGSYRYTMMGCMLLYALATASIFLAGRPEPYTGHSATEGRVWH